MAKTDFEPRTVNLTVIKVRDDQPRDDCSDLIGDDGSVSEFAHHRGDDGH